MKIIFTTIYTFLVSGQNFAIMEMKAVISKILRNYELLPAENFKMKLLPEMVQKPAKDIQIKIRRRSYQ